MTRSAEQPRVEPRPLTDFDPSEVSSIALKAFFRLADEWQLTNDEMIILLGRPSARTFYRWKAGRIASLPHDTLERISVLLGIYKALHILLPIRDRAHGWVKRPNQAFDGASALEVMLRGRVDNLYQMRRHLDAWRG